MTHPGAARALAVESWRKRSSDDGLHTLAETCQLTTPATLPFDRALGGTPPDMRHRNTSIRLPYRGPTRCAMAA